MVTISDIRKFFADGTITQADLIRLASLHEFRGFEILHEHYQHNTPGEPVRCPKYCRFYPECGGGKE
jgi:hypothetical protein